MRKKDKALLLFLAGIFFLVLLILVLGIRTYSQYSVLQSHRDYFKQHNISIQQWMTIHVIEKQFNISKDVIYQQLRINGSMSNERASLETICRRNGLDCPKVIKNLEALRPHD